VFILGISALAHDPAAALVSEPGILAAIEESKLERARNVSGIPRSAIRFCLERAGITWRDVGSVAVASRPVRAWSRRALLRARLTPVAPVSSGYYQSKVLGELGRELNNARILKDMAGAQGRMVPLDHHLCHAASAFYASPFDRALILTLDEDGDGRSGLVAMGEGLRIRARQTISFPHSLAWIYSQVTELLGYRPHEEEHKTQWLSLAGEPAFAGVFLEMLRSGSGPYPHLNARFFRRGFAGRLAFSDLLYRRLGISPPPAPLPEALRANLASSVQQACATVVTGLAEALRRRSGARHLCLAGGLFLNPLLVAVIERDAGFEQVFVPPAPGNEGTSLGAAWVVWHQQLGKQRSGAVPAPYWGPAYSNDEIKKVLDNCKASYRWAGSEAEKIEQTLRLLKAGKIVAWFQGPAEFGPRALGNRSLLASPWAPYVKENLNDYVKRREGFRPFALSVPEDDCSRYFECSALGRTMATVGRIKPEHGALFEGYRLPGDGVRLHVVAADANPLFWKLLKSFGTQAAAPMLVNTSFNLFGEPLVVTPRDAVRSYFCSGTDALVIGNFLLAKG
jgi:carbamoyltransferase